MEHDDREVTRRIVVAEDDLLVRTGIEGLLATIDGFQVVAGPLTDMQMQGDDSGTNRRVASVLLFLSQHHGR